MKFSFLERPVPQAWPGDELLAGRARMHAALAGAPRLRSGPAGPTPIAGELEPLGDPGRPYQTVATWYGWQAAGLPRSARGICSLPVVALMQVSFSELVWRDAWSKADSVANVKQRGSSK